MKRLYLTVFTLACVLLSHAPAYSQRRGKAVQARVVKGQVLTSSSLPQIRIRFDRKLKYVGSQKFVLYERAQAEQHFFVDAARAVAYLKGKGFGVGESVRFQRFVRSWTSRSATSS